MLIVPLEQARAGMTLAMTVAHPEQPDQDLLRAGYVLDAKVIARMRGLGVACLYVEYPGLEDLDKYLAPYLSAERQVMYSKIRSTFNAFQRDANPTVDFTEYYSATRSFISTLLSGGRNPIFLDVLAARLGGDGVNHAMSVAHLSLVLGVRLDRYLIAQRKRLPAHHAKEVVSLGVAGMLHDLGKTRLPPEMGKLSCLDRIADLKQRREWESHARIGYEMIRDEVEPSAAAAVLHHHQHFDGCGFPARDLGNGAVCGLAGERIHIYARILQAADLYDRLTLREDGKTRRMNLEILHLMRTQYQSRIDPEILQMMPGVVPPFPPGATVTLSDSRRAIVSSFDPDHPYSPTVKVLMSDGWTMSGEVISLVRSPYLCITAVGGVDVEALVPAGAIAA